MRLYFDKSLKAVSLAATVAMVGVSSLACAGPAQGNKVTDDDRLTAEHCIDTNATKGSVEPFEDALVAEGLVDTNLDKISITHGMCEEIIERTPGGSPVERAAAVGNLTQELEIIKKSMEDAAEKDVNGDGRVNAEDTKIASAASYAASHAAQETVRRAAEQGSTDGGVIGALNAVPAAYLTQQQTTSVPSEQTTSVPGEQTTSVPSEQTPSAAPASASASASSASASANASAAANASASANAAAGEARSAGLPLREEAQTNASSAAREKGAGPEAAAGGGQCAATVAVSDRTLQLQKGTMGFKAPAKEMHWKGQDRAQLVVAQKAWGPIEKLKQVVDQAKGAGKAEAQCLHLGRQMEPKIVSEDGIDIKWIDARKQEVLQNASIRWRWDIVASEIGRHPLYLNVTGYVYTPEGGSPRHVYDSLYEDYINVSATRWEVFTDFVARRWSVLVPLLLTIVTAIIIPFVVPWWRRRHQPREPRDTSSAPRDDRWI